ncbi:MAG TPA: hypothetical protein VL326_32785 [Kofleriaceae bacterium]|nr:hypothetical protein [Kofleriaceae bacterium]
MRRLPGSGVGVLLALLNVAIISAGMGVATNEPGIAVFVFAFTFIPAIFAGAILGALGEMVAERRPAHRILVLGALALVVLTGLARLFEMESYVPFSAIPTGLLVYLLERITRREPSEPPIPIAVVR